MDGDVRCPHGFLYGHDYNKHFDCCYCDETMWSCASYYKSCIKKADLGSETMAEHEAQKREGYVAYHCEYCGGWHIGRSYNE